MTKQEIIEKINKIKTNQSLPEKQRGQLLEMYENKLAELQAKEDMDDKPKAKPEPKKEEIKEERKSEPKPQKEKKDKKGIDVLLFKVPEKSELKKGMEVAYKDTYGDFTKIGEIKEITKEGFFEVGGGMYMNDELRLIKKAKKDKSDKMSIPECDELVKKWTDAYKKRQANKDKPKPTPSEKFEKKAKSSANAVVSSVKGSDKEIKAEVKKDVKVIIKGLLSGFKTILMNEDEDTLKSFNKELEALIKKYKK